MMVSVDEQMFAVPLDWIQSITQTPEILPLPGLVAPWRGAVELQNVWMPLLDLRVAIGLNSAAVERRQLVEALHARRAEHVRWLDQLSEAVEERAPFRGELDPTRCAFGRWYLGFKPKTHSMSLLFNQFGKAHIAIHQVAAEVDRLQRTNQHEAARERVALARTKELSELMVLFERTFALFEEPSREVALALVIDDTPVALSVDQVHRMQSVTLIDGGMENQLVRYQDGKHAVMFDMALVRQ